MPASPRLPRAGNSQPAHLTGPGRDRRKGQIQCPSDPRARAARHHRRRNERTRSLSQRTSPRNPYSSSRPWRGDRGAGSAELVIAVPLLMLLILLIVQFAVWAHASSVAQATAEEALAAARVQGGSAAAGQQRAQQVISQIGGTVLISPRVSVTRTATTVTVTVTATAQEVLPVPGLSLPVSITVTGPAERFVPATAPG